MAASRRHRQDGRKSKKPIPKSTTGRAGEPASLRRAKALWQQGKLDESLKHFGHAVRENRWNIQVLIDAARAYGARYLPEKSEPLLERAASLGSRSADVQFLIGETYRMLGRFDAAERSFRKSVTVAEKAPRAQLELANLCERTHRLEEGLELIQQVLRTWPQSASAAILKARLLRRRGEAELAETTLRTHLARSTAKPALQAEAWGELAQLLDRSARYDEAWQAIEQAKELLREREQAVLRAAEYVTNRFVQLSDDVQGRHFEDWQREQPALPTRIALLTGFPRSGTTLLEQVLDAHPDLVSCEEQEIFSAEIFPSLGSGHPRTPVIQVLEELPQEEIGEARTKYLKYAQSVLHTPIGERLLLDKNPAMTQMIPVVMRLFPEMKLIFALRDPRDVVLSCYLRYLPLNPVSVHFLTIERTATRYVNDMLAWQKYRQWLAGAWVEVVYERLVDDLTAETSRVLRLLDLDWRDELLAYRERSRNKTVLSPTYDAVTEPIHRNAIGRWRNYATQMEAAFDILQPMVSAWGYDSQ